MAIAVYPEGAMTSVAMGNWLDLEEKPCRSSVIK